MNHATAKLEDLQRALAKTTRKIIRCHLCARQEDRGGYVIHTATGTEPLCVRCGVLATTFRDPLPMLPELP